MSTSAKKLQHNIFLRMHPLTRVFISIIISVTAYLLISKDSPVLIKLTSSWTVFSATYLIMCWIVIFKKSPEEIRRTAPKDDGSKVFVFLAILISSFSSMFAVLLLIISKDSETSQSKYFVPASVFGMLLSWAMVHTLFAFHYAHKYYDDSDDDSSKAAGGLDFPGNETKPDYVDFAYFSFVIGCTFQVSDVEISSRDIRRLAFLHQIISFLLNTFVVALSINLIAGLSK